MIFDLGFRMDWFEAGMAAHGLQDLWGRSKNVTKVPLEGEPWGRQQKDRASTAAPGINSLWAEPGKVRGFLLAVGC